MIPMIQDPQTLRTRYLTNKWFMIGHCKEMPVQESC